MDGAPSEDPQGLVDEDHLFLQAEVAAEVVGLLEARVDTTGGVFEPKRLLHVSAIYVRPERRRQGIARHLLELGFAWGRERACAEARLNALAANPARTLYASLGFQEFRIEMRGPLASLTVPRGPR